MTGEMTSKERMLIALEGGKPDRLPVSVHQWQGYHLETSMSGLAELDAFAVCGMDAQIQYFQDMGQFWLVDADLAKFSTPKWIDEAETIRDDPDDRIVHHTIRTPGGTLSYKIAGNRMTTWITEYLIKRDEDIDLIRDFMPVPTLDLRPVAEAHDRVGDRGILRGFVWGDQAGCWQHAACLMDITTLTLACFDKPEWVHAFLEILLEKKLRFIESMAGARFDLIETGGGAASSTIISPALHEEFCLPYDRRMHAALHDLGFKISYHTCGGTLGIEELIVANGCDVSETLAPVSIGGNQEPWEFRSKVGDRLAMIGGMDQFNVMTRDAQTIRAMVARLFEGVGSEGGFICSMADHFFELTKENLEVFAAAARECTY